MKNKIVLMALLGVILIGTGFGVFYYYKSSVKSDDGSKKQEKSSQTTKSDSSETDLGSGVTVKKIDSKYKTASGKTSGWFKSGQEADIMLSGIDFNNTGGPLLFNHLGGVASDGTRLILADRNNNRVLIWNKLPDSNQEPDLVLGQKNFTSNNPGEGLDALNWPVAVATNGTHLYVADTYNDRILIWNSFPTQNGQAADLEIKGVRGQKSRSEVIWPWAVWTKDQKLVVASTGASKVLIWNSLPTQNNQEADIVLDLKDAFGTPRAIGSDGKTLIIGDHNAKVNDKQGNFFWKTFPTADNQNYDFFMASAPRSANIQTGSPPNPESANGSSNELGEQQPSNPSQGTVCDPPPAPCNPPSGEVKGESTQSQFPTPTPTQISASGDIFWSPVYTSEGKLLILAGAQIDIWNAFPEDENDDPDLVVGTSGAPGDNSSAFNFMAGDGSGLALAGEKLYLSLSNGNRVVAFNALPTKEDQKPDFAIGSPDIDTNTLETNFIISNPQPISNDQSLFVSSDFDRKLHVWKNLPDESGAHPDLVYSLPDGPWDNDLYGDTLALAGKKTVIIWKKLPTDTSAPFTVFKDKIGSVSFGDLSGVAIDEKYFYLADTQNKKISVWEGIPDANSQPKFTLGTTNQPGKLSSNGKYLLATHTTDGSSVSVYKVSDLSDNSQPQSIGGKGTFNLPQNSTLNGNKLFIADTGFNRVHIWDKIEDALAGKNADVMLGLTGEIERAENAKPQIGKDKLFWPSNPYFDGSYLWLGEFKFSERILRFSPE